MSRRAAGLRLSRYRRDGDAMPAKTAKPRPKSTLPSVAPGTFTIADMLEFAGVLVQ